ncbi:hypothetical protein LINGRAHAP2_LOCUS3772 [Linum grandiflorum]
MKILNLTIQPTIDIVVFAITQHLRQQYNADKAIHNAQEASLNELSKSMSLIMAQLQKEEDDHLTSQQEAFGTLQQSSPAIKD